MNTSETIYDLREEQVPTVGGLGIGTVSFWIALGFGCLVGAGFYYFTGIKVLGAAMVGIVLAVSAFIAPQTAFYLYFGWQVFDAVFLTSPTQIFTPAKAFAFFIILVYVVSLGRIRHKILVSKPVIAMMAIFGLFGLLTSFQAIVPLRALVYSLQILVQAFLVVAALHILDSTKRIHTAFLCCYVAGVIAGMIMLAGGAASEQYGRGTLGEYANPTTTGLALSVSFIALPGLWILKKPKMFYLLCMAGAAPILIGIMNTGSRAPLVAILMALGFGILFAKGSGFFKRIITPAIIAVLIGGTIIYVLSANILIGKSQERLEELVLMQTTGGGLQARAAIWSIAFTTYAEHSFLLGFGSGNTAAALEQYAGWQRDIHNSLLGPLVDSGPIGFALFAGALALLFKKVRGIRNVRMNVIATMIYIFILLSMLTHTIHFTKWFWIPVTMCLLLVEQSNRQELSETDWDQESAIV